MILDVTESEKPICARGAIDDGAIARGAIDDADIAGGPYWSILTWLPGVIIHEMLNLRIKKKLLASNLETNMKEYLLPFVVYIPELHSRTAYNTVICKTTVPEKRQLK